MYEEGNNDLLMGNDILKRKHTYMRLTLKDMKKKLSIYKIKFKYLIQKIMNAKNRQIIMRHKIKLNELLMIN